jgi:hypothetical protein
MIMANDILFTFICLLVLTPLALVSGGINNQFTHLFLCLLS